MSGRRRLLQALTGALGVLLVCLILAFLIPLPERLEASDGRVVTWDDGTPMHVSLSSDEKWRFSAPLETVDSRYLDALIAFEDQRFWSHPGVDVMALGRAFIGNLGAGKRVSGASTITMQLVRLLEPRPRTYTSKLIEVFRAMQLELRLSKREILENYLRFISFGRNVEGIHAGSLAYFGREARVLSYDEIAVLLAVPQSPTARYPHPNNLARLREARDRIGSRLLEVEAFQDDGASPEDVFRMIQESSLPTELVPFPRRAPHVAQLLATADRSVRLQTTLDSVTQTLAEDLLGRHQEAATRSGIQHAAIVVVDHKELRVRAAVGNFDFGADPGSQIAAFNVPRSTGSLLKPVIFAMAIEEGLAHPRHLIEDVPAQFGTYKPENYDGRFRGLVRYDEALAASLNLPFIVHLSLLGVDAFANRLRLAGARDISTKPGFYGLSAAVGGIEMRPLDIAGLFAALANGGRARTLSLVPDSTSETQVFTPAASYLTREALRLRDRPDFDRLRLNRDAPRFLWKTGTSFGNRDAWAVGSGARYTVAVWMGNLDQSRSSALVGSERCGPLLFDILQALEPVVPADLPPEGMIEVNVCAYSGHLPAKACPEKTNVLAPMESVATRICPFHKRLEVDTATGLAVRAECRAGRDVESRSFVVWPAALRRYLSAQSSPLPMAPPYAPECGRSSDGLQIVQPQAGHRIRLIPGLDPEEQRVPLEAQAADGRQTLYWFVDGEWIGEAPASERIWWVPTPGEHQIVVQDARGGSQSRTLHVIGTGRDGGGG